MTTKWEFQHSFFTIAGRSMAWAFWANMQNHAEMENVTIELDGPFRTGTIGRTISDHLRQEWELSEVIEEKRFVTTGRDSGCELSFAWGFEDEGTGTRMTQTISAQGPKVEMEKWSEVFGQMEINAPKGMQELSRRLDSLASDSPAD